MKWRPHAKSNPDSGKGVFTQQKTGRVVRVPMHLNLVHHLHELAGSHASGYLCPTLAKKRIGGKSGLSETFKRVMHRAGLDAGEEKGKGVRQFNRRTFHSFRHSFASALANVSVPEVVRMKLTGHTSRDMHSRYTHLNVEPLKQASSQLPFVGVSTA